jgi:peptidoglycan/xylan/chitin deacetylase (PgdA/CDA1 family)
MKSSTILTFDYELFLGEDSGTVMKSIIEPIDKIIKLLKQYNAKAIFFVDATYLMALKKYNHPDLLLVKKQLQDIVSIGSSVELHLHPQWLDAKPFEDRWVFESFDRYRLHLLTEDEIQILFKNGIKILEDITGRKVQIFRAGGWSITPFEKLKKAFINNNIKIDMSVCPGFYRNELPMHFYNFLNTPKKEYYKFQDDVVIENNEGIFIEVPVSTYTMHGLDLVLNNIIKKCTNDKYFGDGKGLVSVAKEQSIIKRIFKMNLRNATIEFQSNYFFKKSLNKIKNKELLSYVMHPKTLSKSSLVNFEYLLKKYDTLNSSDLIEKVL